MEEKKPEKHELRPLAEKLGATLVGKSTLTKDKTFKIRLDSLEVSEVDRIARELGYAERATAVRWLIHNYDDIKKASGVMLSYLQLLKAEANFKAVTENASTKPTEVR